MALAERAALAVFAGQAHADALPAAAHRTPVPRRWPSRCPRRSSSIACLASSWRAIRGCTSNPAGTRVSAVPICFSSARRTAVACSIRSASGSAGEAGPVAFEPVGLVRLVGLRRGVGVFQRAGEFVPHRLRLRRRDDALGREAFGVQRARRLQLVDRAIHQRLGEGRFVGLVVAVAAVADDVQHDVAWRTACGIPPPCGRRKSPPPDRRR